jgi:hypothetical protein
MSFERHIDEQSPEAKLHALRGFAATLPVIDPQLTRGREIHEEFGGEFYRRFAEINRVQAGEATDAEVFYVRMVKERFGYDLVDFYNRNHELCEAICSTVATKEPYDILASGYLEVCRNEAEGLLPPGSARTVQESINHPAGIEAIGMYYWDQINPLLEQAYSLIDQEILNAPFLTK